MSPDEREKLRAQVLEDLNNAWDNGYHELRSMSPKEVLDDLNMYADYNYDLLPPYQYAEHVLLVTTTITEWQEVKKRELFSKSK